VLQSFGYVAIFFLVGIGFAGIMLILPVLLRRLKVIPHKPNTIKSSTVECGLETTGRSWVRFNPHYYFFALLAVALDVMLIFVLLWAVVLADTGTFALWTGGAFIAILLTAYTYAWRKDALRWK